MPTSRKTSSRKRALRLALAASLLFGASAAASDEAGTPKPQRRVPADVVGAWCPSGGCETPAGGPWQTAGFATALGAVVLLSRRNDRL
jgi:hypothetical protein